jgi:hypothetical protein
VLKGVQGNTASKRKEGGVAEYSSDKVPLLARNPTAKLDVLHTKNR